jgi:hypothetical protein
MSFGTGGTGGASVSAGLPLPGDGARNERSVMDPELDCLRRPGAPGCCLEKLPFDDSEPRRTMRFVTVLPTGVGVVACVRRAAAAAADERSPLDSAFLMKALEAASEADALGGGARWACMGKNC